ARGQFRRHGGGILEDGIYVFRPKRDSVLVPFDRFHHEMLQEMTREAHVVMGRIGAKRLVVETIEGVAFGGSIVSRVPGKSGSLTANFEQDQERAVTFAWGSPTFEPEEALRDCVWIQD